MTPRKRQQGMSLIEMMIAMTISLLVIGAVSGVYLSSSRNYSQDEMLSRMQENARFALHVLAEDLSMVGYWGPLITGQDIENTNRDCTATPAAAECQTPLYEDSVLPTPSDCGPGTGTSTPPIWAYSLEPPIEYRLQVSSRSDANSVFTCISTNDEDGFLAEADARFEVASDILVVKRVESQELDSDRDDADEPGNIYLRTDGTDAMLFEYDPDLNVSEGTGIKDWRYRSNIYYIRDYFLNEDEEPPIPTLVRKSLQINSSGNVAMETESGGVAQGIEYFHVMFGIDSNGDTTANYYTSDPDPTSNELDNATSARIYVLARSAAEDPNYDNDKTYHLGDMEITFNDNFYRRVFTTTVILRNQRNRISTSGS